jgi:lipopolysaccharide export LptBFGC system permease protein LptF
VISLKDVRITHYGQRDKTSYGELVSENYSIAVPMRQRTKDRPEFLTVAQLAEQIRDLRERIRAFSASYEQANTQEEEAYAARVLTKLVYMRRKAEIELHRRGADALAPFLFLLVGIPFPLLLKSRVKLVPAFAALMTLMATSFAVGLAAESLAESGSLDPWYAMWLGDILTACVGVFLFWKLLEK